MINISDDVHVIKKGNMMSATSEAGPANASETPLSSYLAFSGFCIAQSLVFYVVFCSTLFVYFLLVYCLSFFSLQFMIYPF